MIKTSAPIHTCTINGSPLRFFSGPGDEPDMPWHEHEQLLAALALPRSLRRSLRAAILRHWPKACRTVDVEGEPILIAPHFVGQGLIDMAQEAGREITTTPDLVDREYHRAGVAALGALTAHLSSAEDRVAWAMAAFRNQGAPV